MLDLNRLIRRGLVHPGERFSRSAIRWAFKHCDAEIASGVISAEFQSDREGVLRIANAKASLGKL